MEMNIHQIHFTALPVWHIETCVIMNHGSNFLFKGSLLDFARLSIVSNCSRSRSQKEKSRAVIWRELWRQRLLGTRDAQTLLDTITFMYGLYFALRSGQEHRSLIIDQNEVVDCEHPYLIDTENVSRNHSWGWIQPKVVIHYSPSRCSYIRNI